MSEEREIKIKSFVWQEEYENPVTGVTGVVQREGKRGQVVDLPEHAAARGDELDAFVTEADLAPETTEEGLAVLEMDDEELTNWVSESTIPQVINAANDDPELASRLLEAENAATGNDPRVGLVEGLAAVAGRTE